MTEAEQNKPKKTWKSRRVLVPAVAALAVIGVGGGLFAASIADDDLKGDTLDRASKAALQETGEGTVTGAEKDDGLYEVEVTRKDGTEIEVRLDKDYQVVSTETDGPDGDGDDDRFDDDDRYDDDRYDDDRDADDEPLTAAEDKAARKAALAEIDGTVTDVDREYHGSELGFEVEITKADGSEWNVELDGDYKVLGSYRD